MMNSTRDGRAWLIVITAHVPAALVVAVVGCGTALNPLTPSPSGATQAQSQPATGPKLGYVWDAASQSLRPLQGVAGASIVGPATVTAPAQGPGYISIASSVISGSALFLDANGGIYQSALTGGAPTKIAMLPGATTLMLSNSGSNGLVIGKSSADVVFAAGISGLPAAPLVHSLNVSSLPSILAGAASDTGTVALVAGSDSGGVSIIAFVGQNVGTKVATVQAFGGLQFVPGSDELVVADGASGALTAISHVNTAPASAVLSAAGGIAAPAALDITSNGRWVVAANHSGDLVRVDLTGVAAASKAHCSCAPSQVVALSGNTVHLVTAGAGPLWIVDAGSSAPRVLFVPAIRPASVSRERDQKRALALACGSQAQRSRYHEMRAARKTLSRGCMSNSRIKMSEKTRSTRRCAERARWSCLALRAVGLLAVALSGASALHAQITFAGAQTTVPASLIGVPTGVAVDAAGDLFIADPDGNRVVELPSGGGAQVVVGNGLQFPGGTPLSGPERVAVDQLGDVFIADTGNNRVVKVPAGGAAITLVIAGLGSPEGLAVDQGGDVFIGDTNNNRVVEVLATGGQTTVGVGFNAPEGVAIDASGDLFVADSGNDRVVEVPAGCTTANCQVLLGNEWFFPTGVAVDSLGDVFVADSFVGGQNVGRVVKLLVNGAAPTVGTGLTAARDVAIDGGGDVYIADNGSNSDVIREQTVSVSFGRINVCPTNATTPAPCTGAVTLNYSVTAGTTLLDPVVTTGGAQGLDFTVAPNSTCTGTVTGTTCVVNVTFTPSASGLRAGAVTVTQAGECEFLPCNLPHATTPISGTGLAPDAAIFGIIYGYQPATASADISGVAVDGAGNYYYSDQGGNTVYKVVNGVTTAVAFRGLVAPQQLAIDGSGAVYVLTGGSQIIELAANGVQFLLLSTVAALTPNLEAYLENIGAFALDARGDIYVGGPAVGTAAGEVVKLDNFGNLTVVGSGYGNIRSMTVGPDGTVYVVSFSTISDTTTVNTISPSGQQGTLATGLPVITAIAVDAGGTVYLVENAETPPFNEAFLLAIDATGVQTTYQLPGVDIPNQLAITPLGGFYIANETGSQTGNPSGSIYFYSRDATGGFGFNDVPVGTTSLGFPTSVFNIGNEPLTIFKLSYVGPFSESPVASSSPAECGSTLGAGTSSSSPTSSLQRLLARSWAASR